MAEGFSESAEIKPDAPTLTGRAILGAKIGNMLEFYDFITYSFFAIQIGHTFFPSHSQFDSLMLSLATFGVGFITRPIGAWVIGAYSDRVGRTPAMIFSFAVMGSAIVVLAPLRSSRSPPPCTVFCSWRRGWTDDRLSDGGRRAGEEGCCGRVVAASPQIAATAGALMGLVLSATLSADGLESYGWRIAFLFGALALPFGLWMRENALVALRLQIAANGRSK